MPLGTEVGLGLGNIVLDGHPVPPRKGAQQPVPLFGPFCCGQTAGWIRIPLGMEVGLDPGDIVLDGGPDPPPHFSAHVYCGTQMSQLERGGGTSGRSCTLAKAAAHCPEKGPEELSAK